MTMEFIKYEKLSKDIKQEIENFHKMELKKTKNASIDESMVDWFKTKFDEWLIKRYQKVDSRRKHFRLDVEIPIKIIDTLIESSGDDVNAIDFVGKILNISRGGLYFKYTSAIEVSSIIKVIIDLSELDKELNNIEALAMVVRVNKIGKNEYGIGIMFSSIYDSNKESLDLFILKNLSYHMYSEH